MVNRFRFVALFVALGVLLGLQIVSASEISGKYLLRFVPDPSAPMKGDSHEVLVSFLQDQLNRNLAAVGKMGGAKILRKLWIINGIEIFATPTQLATIKKLPRVLSVAPVQYRKWIEPGNPVQVRPDPSPVQWSIAKVRAPEVWQEFKIDGSGVVVGHLDTGVDAQHPALKGKVLAFRDFTPANKPLSYDDQGHGTHTAGSIAASNGIGVAPGARLIVAKVFDKKGSAEDSWLIDAMQWVMDPDGNPETNDGPSLVNNSWGSDTTTDRTFWDIVRVWEAANIFPIFAAGNSGPSGKVGTPANFPHSWAVAATTNKDTIAYFSSVGPSVWDGVTLVKPDIAAPGNGVISCAIGGGLVSNMGTSMACPHVAGLAALMIQANPKLTIAEMRQIAEATAVDLGTPGKDNKFGSGRFDALACVKKIVESTSLANSFTAYESALQAEAALTGIQAGSPLAAPLARSIIMRGLALDEGEFSSMTRMVFENSGESAKKLLSDLIRERRADKLQK